MAKTLTTTDADKARRHAVAVNKRLWGSKPKKLVQRLPCDQRAHVDMYYEWIKQTEVVRSTQLSAQTMLRYNPSPYVTSYSMSYEPQSPIGKVPLAVIAMTTLRNFPDVTIAQVKGPSRNKKIVAARHECIWQAKKQRPDLSFPQIGIFFNRDHTLILYAYHKLQGEKFGDEASIAFVRRKRDREKSLQSEKSLETQSELG